MTSKTLILGVLASASALHEIPHHARGGALWADYRQRDRGQPPLTSARWVELPLDHFDENEHRTFRCRYYVDDSAWAGRQAAPSMLFFEMGGEGPATGTGGGFIAQLAVKRRARVVAIEHRFYGESVPGGVPNASSPGGLITSNLRYLTVRQALADAAALIDYVSPRPQAVPMFTFGGYVTTDY